MGYSCSLDLQTCHPGFGQAGGKAGRQAVEQSDAGVLCRRSQTAPIFILVFSLARANSYFLPCFLSSVFLVLLFDLDDGGTFFGTVDFHHWLHFGLELKCIWPGKSRHRWGALPSMRCVSTGAYVWEWLTLVRHSAWLWLVVLIREQWILVNQITATGWTHRHWIFPQLTCFLFYWSWWQFKQT